MGVERGQDRRGSKPLFGYPQEAELGEGRHASESFVRSVERNAGGGESIISSKGKGLLRAANQCRVYSPL